MPEARLLGYMSQQCVSFRFIHSEAGFCSEQPGVLMTSEMLHSPREFVRKMAAGPWTGRVDVLIRKGVSDDS